MRHPARFCVVLLTTLAAVVVALAPTPATAAAGDPIWAYGSNGTVYDGNSACEVEKIADVLAEPGGGALVLAAADCGTQPRIELVRYTGTGARDATFSGDGRLLLDLGMHIRGAGGVLPGPDGGYVVLLHLGMSLETIRVSAGGTLDTAFGEGGKASAQLDSDILSVHDVEAVAGGGMRAVVSTWGPTTQLVQLTGAGALDPAFSEDGVVTLDVNSSGPPDDAVLRDGALVTVSSADTAMPGYDVAVRRYLSTGALDPAFSDDGFALRTVGALNTGFQVAWHPAGDIYVAGAHTNRLIVHRVSADGTWATAWGGPSGNGASIPVSGTNRVADLMVDADSRVAALAAGTNIDTVRVARLAPDTGLPDFDFADAGLAEVRLGLTTVAERLIALDGGDLLAVSQTCCPSWSNDFALTRLAGTTAHRTTFVSLAPERLLDTRRTGGAVANGGTRTVPVLGVKTVPSAGVGAVVLNVTIVAPTGGGFATVFPAGRARPLASNVNFAPGQTVANLTTVRVGNDGDVSVYVAGGAAHVLLDVAGYYTDGTAPSAGSEFIALPIKRILDTRPGRLVGDGAEAPLGPFGQLQLDVVGRPEIPAEATAVVLTVTAVTPTSSGFVTVWPSGPRPGVSNVNFARRTASNLVVARLSATGTIRFFNSAGTTHLLADVAGYYTTPTEQSLSFRPLSPRRVYDSRLPQGAQIGKIKANTTRIVQLSGRVPAGPSLAVVANLTATGATASTYLTVYAAGGDRPVASNVNVSPGQTVAIQVVTTLDEFAQLGIYNAAGEIHVVVDLAGYFTPQP